MNYFVINHLMKCRQDMKTEIQKPNKKYNIQMDEFYIIMQPV